MLRLSQEIALSPSPCDLEAGLQSLLSLWGDCSGPWVVVREGEPVERVKTCKSAAIALRFVADRGEALEVYPASFHRLRSQLEGVLP